RISSGWVTSPTLLTPAAFMIARSCATSPYPTFWSALRYTPFRVRFLGSEGKTTRKSFSEYFSSSMKISPARLIDTASPSFVSSGLAFAGGSEMSTPPCIIGAVIMKITSSSSITSIKLTTLTSALRSNRSRRRRRGTSDPAFAHEQRDRGRAEAFHARVEPIEAAGEDVVAEGCRNGDGERNGGGDQRLRHARGDRRQIPRALRRDAEKRVDHAKHGAEQPDERAHRTDRRQPRKEATDPVAFVRRFGVEQQMERLDLRAAQRRRRRRIAGDRGRPLANLLIRNTRIGDEMHGAHEQPRQRARRGPLGESAGFVQAARPREFMAVFLGHVRSLSQSALERNLRRPSENVAGPLHAEERLHLLSWTTRCELDWRRGVHGPHQRRRQIDDRRGDAGTDIEGARVDVAARRQGDGSRAEHGLRHVSDVDVVARLPAVAEYSEGAVAEDAAAEDRDHAGFAMRILPRTVDVREADARRLEAVDAAVIPHVFLDRELGDAVRRVGILRRGLGRGRRGEVAIDRAASRGEDESAGALRGGGPHRFEQVERT